MIEGLIQFIILFVAIGMLVKGGSLIVEICGKLSAILNIDEAIIGATILSFVSTLPELTITILGISQNSSDLVIGNFFGTVLVNICLVLGVLLCFMRLKRTNKKTLNNVLFMLILILIISVVSIIKFLNLAVGILLILVFIIYFIANFVNAKKSIKRKKDSLIKDFDKVTKNKIKIQNDVKIEKNIKQIKTDIKNFNHKKENKGVLIFKFTCGVILIFAGAQLIINSVEKLSLFFNISATFFGQTFVAIGTSLPELVTSFVSIKKKRLNLALGNVIGSNIINLTLLFGLTLVLNGTINFNLENLNFSIVLIALMISAILLSLPMVLKKRTYLWQGYSLVSIYSIYCIIIILLTL